MGIFEFISTVFSAIATPLVKGSTALDESLTIATTLIHNRSVAVRDTDMYEVATKHAKRQAALKQELQGDEDATAIFTDLIAKMQA